jgi:hypothetical protein
MSARLKVLCESRQRARGTRNKERETMVAGHLSAQLLESNTDVLSGGVNRNMSEKRINRLIRLEIESMMIQNVITKVGEDSLVIDHAVGYLLIETHPSSSEVTPARIVQVICLSRRK